MSQCKNISAHRLHDCVPVRQLRRVVHKIWNGPESIIAWHTNHLDNGLFQGINFLVQPAKAHARGYRNKEKMITISDLIAAGLQLLTATIPAPA